MPQDFIVLELMKFFFFKKNWTSFIIKEFHIGITK